MILPATTADSAHQHGRGLLPCGLAARDQALLAVIAVAFFLSGMAALVYQVAWQRILALHTGVGVYSVAAIVASFLGGLGAGSLAGGLLSSRVSARQALRVFAYLELAIGLFGAASCRIYYDWLYLESAWLYAVPLRAALLHFLGLLIPTGLMGMSLPFLARALVWDTAHAGKVVGLLYGINMLGAGAGSLLTPWVFMRFLGVRGAVVAAVVSNLLAAACALGIGLLRPPPAADVPPVVETDPRRLRSERRPFALWVALYGLSGFCALSLEIVWFRLVDVAAKSSAFTFGTVLAVYLFGSALGSLVGASIVNRLSRPLRSFLLMQCLLLAYSGAVVLLLVVTPTEAPLYRWFFAYWRQPEGFRPGGVGDARTLLRLYVLLPILLYGLPTFLMGLSFPVLQRAVHDDPRTSGRKVGLLQAANIAGCVGGSLLVGLVFMSQVGTTGTLRLLLVFGLAFAAVGVRECGLRPGMTVMAASLVLLVIALPGQQRLWGRLHGFSDGSLLVAEDATGVVAFTATDVGLWLIFVNGKSNSELPFSGEHTLLGALPALIHLEPADVAIVGLGSGNTAWAAGCRPETRRVTVFEIAAPQLRLLRVFEEARPTPKLRRFLDDPRVRVRVADGRNALERDGALYDFIEADALRPWTAYSGNLYSEEFFARAARRLKPGGVMCTWAPTPRIYATFCTVFPHVVDFGSIVVGSRQPLHMELDVWTSRLRSPEVTSYLGPFLANQVLKSLKRARLADRLAYERTDTNRDLFPRDEFMTP